MKKNKQTPDAASVATSMAISTMVAVAVVLTLLWPGTDPGRGDAALAWFNDLPAPAAGISPQIVRRSASPDSVGWVVAAGEAETWLADPDNQEFQAMRSFLTNALISAEEFDHFPEPVAIDLSGHQQKEAIKYLVDSRPGVMSVVYYGEDGGKQSMLVYWPEVAGERIVYTPLGGLAAKAVSDWVQEQIAAADKQQQ